MITAPKIGYLGQLGNQMFQYAVLVGIRAKLGYEIGIPLKNASKKTAIVHDHETGKRIRYGLSLLDCFDLDEKLVSRRDIRKNINNTFEEYQHPFNPEVFQIPDNTALVGYFETEKYFRHAADEVRKRFRFKKEISGLADKAFAKLDRGKPLVAVHVRRGQDRPISQDTHPFVSLEYYKAAMSSFSEDEYDFLVFTDDFAWTKSFIRGYNVIYSEWDQSFSRPDFIDLCLMTKCRHHIIANSSFSWWGAWLAEDKDHTVFAPKVWFGAALVHRDTSDIVPKRWLEKPTC
jgi:hypothetical protein